MVVELLQSIRSIIIEELEISAVPSSLQAKGWTIIISSKLVTTKGEEEARRGWKKSADNLSEL